MKNLQNLIKNIKIINVNSSISNNMNNNYIFHLTNNYYNFMKNNIITIVIDEKVISNFH